MRDFVLLLQRVPRRKGPHHLGRDARRPGISSAVGWPSASSS